MKINVGNMSDELNKLNNNLAEFQGLYQSIFREVEMARSYWNDNRAQVFSSSMGEEKQKSERLYQELSSRRDVFQYLRNEYGRSGNSISYDLNRKANFLGRLSEVRRNICDARDMLRRVYDDGLGAYSSGAAGGYQNLLYNDFDYYIGVIDDCYSEINRYLNDFDAIERQTTRMIDSLPDYTYDNYTAVEIPKP